eukprot:COSAG02_NODE_3717_length_6328_cov_6.689517_2_plen_164_part_00
MPGEKRRDCVCVGIISLWSMCLERLRLACRPVRRVKRCATIAPPLALLALSVLATALLRRLARRMSEVGIPSSAVAAAVAQLLGAPRYARRNGHLSLHPNGPPHAITNQCDKIGPEICVLQPTHEQRGEFESPRITAYCRKHAAPYRQLPARDDHPEPEVEPT